MHRVRVFMNGAASSSGAQDWKGELQRALFRSRVEFVTATSCETLQQELEKAASENVDVVISVGGDGTFNTLLQSLATTSTTFLVVPAGTANDLATELGIHRKIRKAVECIRKNEVATIDLISINGRYMATNGGIGLVSDVAARINDFRRKVPGFRSMMSVLHHHTYSLALLGHLAAGCQKTYRVRVESPAYRGELETPLLLVNNQPRIGGSFCVAPKTRNADGHFNVTIFTHPKWTQLVTAIYRVKEGIPVDDDPHVLSFETDALEVTALEEGELLNFFGDGEFLSSAPVLDIRMHRQGLRVFRPQVSAYEKSLDTPAPVALGEPNTL